MPALIFGGCVLLVHCPVQWWTAVKKLSGISKASSAKNNITGTSLANCVNEGFLTPMKDFQPLTEQPTLEPVPLFESSLVVTSAKVFKALFSAINPTKDQGPDGMPRWLLKENADLLADPIRDILNTSYREGCLPRPPPPPPGRRLMLFLS